MEGLVLKVGGRLQKATWVYDEAKPAGTWATTDVTADAASYLMDTVALDQDLRLRDLFELLKSNELLRKVFARESSEELLKEVATSEAVAYSPDYVPDGIEYLELYQMWYIDSDTREVTGSRELCFHGVGHVLREDSVEDTFVHFKAGSRRYYGVEMRHVSTLLNIPVRFDKNVSFFENDNETYTSKKLESMVMAEPTLGEVLQGILSELSYFGGPAEAEELVSELEGDIIQIVDASQN